MKIIFSRKGFDSRYGGVPSPILPDGKMYSLPIRDCSSLLHYEDITYGKFNLGEIVEELTRGTTQKHCGVHLDPDLRKGCFQRKAGWRPMFGQANSAQGHLRNQDVGTDDLFLFFGLFQEVNITSAPNAKLKMEYSKVQTPKHVLWGWMQIDEVRNVGSIEPHEFPWGRDHPHFRWGGEDNNTLYIARDSLSIPECSTNGKSGAGVFEYFHPELQLTSSGSRRLTDWELPISFYPEDGKTPMTYHSSLERWRIHNKKVHLKAASIGQEFVLDGKQYPDCVQWAYELIQKHG